VQEKTHNHIQTQQTKTTKIYTELVALLPHLVRKRGELVLPIPTTTQIVSYILQTLHAQYT